MFWVTSLVFDPIVLEPVSVQIFLTHKKFCTRHFCIWNKEKGFNMGIIASHLCRNTRKACANHHMAAIMVESTESTGSVVCMMGLQTLAVKGLTIYVATMSSA